jgi:hypothetical protein
MTFQQIWPYLDTDNLAQLHKNIPAMAGDIAAALIAELLQQEEISLGFMINNRKDFTCVTVDEYDGDKQLFVRLRYDGKYDVYFSYFNDEGEGKSISHILTDEQVLCIPEGLKKLMTDVLKSETGITVRKKEIGN